MAIEYSTSRYEFLKTSASDIICTGEYYINAVPYSDEQTIYPYPFGYNDMHTDSFGATYTAFGFPVQRHGRWTVKADGYGTLVLPHGTYTNTLRVKGIKIIKDISSFGITRTFTTYTWFHASEKFPVLEMETEKASGFVNSTYSSVKVNLNVVGIGEINSIAEKINVYPNPANEKIGISLELKQAGRISYAIFDYTGREVHRSFETAASAGFFSDNSAVGHLPEGIYLLKIKINGSEATRKFVVQH